MTGVDIEMSSHKEMIDAMKALEVMVDPKGGINSPKHITDLIKWMTDAECFDVRIIYVCVVNATESRDILSQFIQQGGWNCLAKWLEYFITSNKHAAIRELLLCFQKLPIEAKTLSAPVDSKVLPGKMIKSLRKHDDQEIKDIASTVYTSWVDLVKQDDERKAARKREKKAKEEVKAKKQKTQEQKKKEEKKKKELKAKKKEEKKKKEEAKKAPIQFNEHLSFLNDIGKQQATPATSNENDEGSAHSKFENLGNRSPPMHHHGENLNGIKGSPPHKNDILPRKEPKPGAKAVRWSDSINRPLEQVREFEVIPNERVNVNNRDYKILMETEAFKEESGPGVSLGDLAPKRQWRSPKRSTIYLSQQVQKNLEGSSKDSTEKQAAAEKTGRTLQQIYLKAQIPMTPTEPDATNQAPVGDIPRIPLQMKDSQPEKQEAAAPAPLPDIDFNLLNSIVDNAKNNSTSNSRSPSGSRQTPPPQTRNPYDSYAPPPSGHYPYRGSSPLVNDHRDQYRDQYRRDYGSRPGYDRPHSYERERPRYGRENSPSGYQRRSRSPQRDQYSRDRNEPYRRPDSYRNQNGYRR